MDKKMWDTLNHIFGGKLGELSKYDNSTPEEFVGEGYSKTESSGVDEYGNSFTKITYISKDGKRRFTKLSSHTVVNMKPQDNLTAREAANRLYTLEAELPIAIEKEEFEKAAQMRDEIAKLKRKLKSKI